jgi:hypothetical protein
MTTKGSIMNFAKTIARKAIHASEAIKSYFGLPLGDYGQSDEARTQQAADAGQARAKIKRVFDA